MGKECYSIRWDCRTYNLSISRDLHCIEYPPMSNGVHLPFITVKEPAVQYIPGGDVSTVPVVLESMIKHLMKNTTKRTYTWIQWGFVTSFLLSTNNRLYAGWFGVLMFPFIAVLTYSTFVYWSNSYSTKEEDGMA